MGEKGFVGDYTRIPKEQLSEALKERLNAATQRLLQQSMEEVEMTLKTESTILERFAQELLKRDELDYDEIVAIFKEYGKPPKSLPSSSEVSQPKAEPALPVIASNETKNPNESLKPLE